MDILNILGLVFCASGLICAGLFYACIIVGARSDKRIEQSAMWREEGQ